MNTIEVVRKNPVTPKIEEGTLAADRLCTDSVIVLAQVQPGHYKWINLEGNRQTDDTWSYEDVLDGHVFLPDGFEVLPYGTTISITVRRI